MSGFGAGGSPKSPGRRPLQAKARGDSGIGKPKVSNGGRDRERARFEAAHCSSSDETRAVLLAGESLSPVDPWAPPGHSGSATASIPARQPKPARLSRRVRSRSAVRAARAYLWFREKRRFVLSERYPEEPFVLI
ncbi:hypothetical protein SKAU_G00142550 [Synaphobranchus kaupii]|uniref:Uncharacterized protein n=1 Tax=Synaphobranchus kaupii TaxID=118154 RepID=A0A9Q1FSZ3_SYNKA|nr:hypothetical protein SKAU_G00142550 [Synaphobranchus kaupii]